MEAKYVSVYKNRNRDGVKDKEDCIDCCFGVESAGFGERSHAVDEFIDDKAKDDVGYGLCDEYDVLYGLFDVYIFEVV